MKYLIVVGKNMKEVIEFHLEGLKLDKENRDNERNT